MAETNETGNYKKTGKNSKETLTKKRMELLEKSIAFLNGTEGGSATGSNPISDNEEDTFGKMVSGTPCRFTPYQRMFAKEKINDVLFDIEYASFQQKEANEHYQPSTSITNFAQRNQPTNTLQSHASPKTLYMLVYYRHYQKYLRDYYLIRLMFIWIQKYQSFNVVSGKI